MSWGMDLSTVLLSRLIISISGNLFMVSKSLRPYGFDSKSKNVELPSVRSIDIFDELIFDDEMGNKSGTGFVI